MLSSEHDDGTVTLCVDYNIENPVIDLDEEFVEYLYYQWDRAANMDF